MFHKFQSSVFKKNLQKAGIAKQVEASAHVYIVQEVLKERFGEGALNHAKPVYIKNRTVCIEIAHPAVGEHIRSQEEAIIFACNQRIGYPEILRIQFAFPKEKEIGQ